jgi:flavin reductase (DIM6/NTAB) family NADH-FMN oxidoreductase RutF
MSVGVDRLREAMGRTAAGVTVVTTDGPAGRAGLTVSSPCSLSLEPASILFCVHAGSRRLAAA